MLTEKCKNIAFYILIGCLIVASIYLVYKYVPIEFFLEGDPKIDELLDAVEPIFQSDNYYVGNLEPLNNRDVLNEIKVYKGKKSYTINKKRVFLCLKDKNGQYYNDNMLIYVFLHELAHVICDEVGHTQKFHDIFQDILDLAHEKGVRNKNDPIIQDYCEY